MKFTQSRSPRGGRGLKYPLGVDPRQPQRRSPRGGRGLKSELVRTGGSIITVAPLAGGVD